MLYLCPGVLPQMTQSRTGTERQRWTRRPRISRPRTFEEGSQGEREIEGKCGERPFSLSQSLKGITNFIPIFPAHSICMAFPPPFF
jgi:hypothetical protein